MKKTNHFFTPVANKSATRNDLGVDSTPTDPTNNGEYPHFCPICMMHFKRILSTQCCSNTICEVCAKEVIQTASNAAPINVMIQQGLHAHNRHGAGQKSSSSSSPKETLQADEDGIFTPFAVVACPFCSRNLKLKRVNAGTKPVKSYKDSPVPCSSNRAGSCGSTASTPYTGMSPPPVFRTLRPPSAANSGSKRTPLMNRDSNVQPSPAKPGDAFAKLRQKVQPLGDATNAIKALEEHKKKMSELPTRKKPFIIRNGSGHNTPRDREADHNLPGAPQRRTSSSRSRRSTRRDDSDRSRSTSTQAPVRSSDLNPLPQRAASPPSRCSVM